MSPPQAVVGRGAVVALLSFQRTNPEDALLHCVQQCVVTRVQMVPRTTHCVEGPMSENQSRGCALLQYIVIWLDSRAAFFSKRQSKGCLKDALCCRVLCYSFSVYEVTFQRANLADVYLCWIALLVLLLHLLKTFNQCQTQAQNIEDASVQKTDRGATSQLQ